MEIIKLSDKKKESITEQKVSRRSMLKWTGALAGAAAVGAVAEYAATYKPPPPPPPRFRPPLSADVQQKVDSQIKQLIDNHAGETWTYGVCVMNCMTNCQLKIYSKEGKVTRIMPDDFPNTGIGREDAYVSMDKIKAAHLQNRPCPLGLSWRHMANSPNRLLYPMKRVGPKGNPNSFVRVSWTEALDLIYNNMKQTKEKYGPLSLFVHGSSNRAVLQQIGAGFKSWGAQSGSGYDAEQTFMGVPTTGPGQADILKSKLVICSGRNPIAVEGPGGTWGLMLLLAKEQGVKFISIDQDTHRTCSN
jgi:anaerobic dimethyl sulfoxide reductase subunit A